MLVVKTEAGKNVGTIELKGDKLVSENPGIESMIESAMRRANGDAKKAYTALSKYSNGYLTIGESTKTVSAQLKASGKGADSDDKATAGSKAREGRQAGGST
jgi:hypothetical protein